MTLKILMPVDGSVNSLRAVEHVIASIDRYKEPPQLLLLNVQWNIAAGNVKMFINQQTIDDYYREQGIAALKDGRTTLDVSELPYNYHISIGSPAEAIAQYTKEQVIDQIVMGRQGQGGMQALLLGSVVNKVLLLVDVPVLLVK